MGDRPRSRDLTVHKAFFTADSWFNIAQVGVAQLGGVLSIDNLNTAGSLPPYLGLWYSSCPFRRLRFVTDGYSPICRKQVDRLFARIDGRILLRRQHYLSDNTTEAATYAIALSRLSGR